MSKNALIIILAIIVVFLIGIVMVTNYSWFSDEWNIGLMMIAGSAGGGGIFAYMKIRGT